MSAPLPLDRRSHLLAYAVFASTLVLYLATLFPGVGGLVNHGDSAKFQFLGVVPGLSHPPGNPLYLVCLALVQKLPVATAALRANAFSALGMATAVAFASETARVVAGRLAAIVTALALALGGLTWTFGTEAEVYALGAAFVAAIAYALARAELDRDGRFLGAALALFALGIANHLTLAMAAPAGLVALVRLHRRGVRVPRATIALIVLALAASLALYGLIPWYSTRTLAYSEFGGPPTFRTLVSYVTAEQFRGALAIPTLDVAVRERPVAMMGVFARQWFLPLYLVAPIGFVGLARRTPTLATALGLSLVAWLAFAFAYAIPDADGFYVPVFVVVAIAIGAATASFERRGVAFVVVLGLLAPGALVRLREARTAIPNDVLEDVGYGVDPELLDLPDLIRRIPRGAMLAVPCSHYGCAEVTNYYRFADEPTQARDVDLVVVEGGSPHHLPLPPRHIAPEAARTSVVCTIHGGERDLLAAHGAEMRTIERGTALVRDEPMTRLPVHCSVPR